MAGQTQTRRILIKVDTGDGKALREISDRMGLLNKNTKNLATNMNFLTNAFRGWLGYLGVRELATMSDTMQNLTNRLKIVTGSLEGAKEALAGIASISDRTSQSLETTGATYVKFANALKSTGANTEELLSLTETLINSFRVSGANAESVSSGILQLSQAFSKGKLDGDEFRSVMEANVTLATALKKEYGQDLYKKAKEGAITITEVLRVLAKEQKNINEGAKQLAPTFSDTLAKSMNTVTVAVGKMNEQFGLAAKFAKGMEFVINNLTEIFIVLGGVVLALAVNQIPKMIAGLQALRVASIAFTASNPILLALTGIATVLALASENLETVVRWAQRAQIAFYELAEAFASVSYSVNQFINNKTGGGINGVVEQNVKAISKFKDAANKIRDDIKKEDDLNSLIVGGKGNDIQKNLESLISKMGPAKEKIKSLKGELSDLNKAYLSGAITLDEYYKKIIAFDVHKLNRQFAEGKEDIFKYHEALERLNLQDLNRALNRGALTLQEFNGFAAANKIEILNEQIKAGKIGLQEYNEELTKLEDKTRPGSAFYTGVSDFIKSAGTLSQGIARVTSQAFDHLADTLTEFVQTGKFQFAEFTRSILNDITAMLIRAAVVRPIAQGILGALGAGAASAAGGAASAGASSGGYSLGVDYGSAFASGGVMTAKGPIPLQKYASGGVANSPQVALFGEGRRPEAYVPLPDGRNIPVKMEGSGGVSLSQTIIINNDGSSSSSDNATGEAAKQLLEQMRRVSIETILQQKRPGGALA